MDKDAIGRFRLLLNAYALALARLYGIDFPVDYPIIVTVEDATTGLERHFKISFEGRFVDAEAVGPLPPLSAEARECLEAQATDFEALAALFPPGSVRFRGFTVFRALDVTDHEVLSSLKRDLIDKESIGPHPPRRGRARLRQRPTRRRALPHLALGSRRGTSPTRRRAGKRHERHPRPPGTDFHGEPRESREARPRREPERFPSPLREEYGSLWRSHFLPCITTSTLSRAGARTIDGARRRLREVGRNEGRKR